MNETKLSGRLTKDPIVRYTSSGKVVTQFILAVDRIRKDDKEEQLLPPWERELKLQALNLFLSLCNRSLHGSVS